MILTLVLEPSGEGREAPELRPEGVHRGHLGVARHQRRLQPGGRRGLHRRPLQQGPGAHLGTMRAGGFELNVVLLLH